MTERESRAWHHPGQVEVYDLAQRRDAAPVVNLCGAILREATSQHATRVRVSSAGEVSYEIEGAWRAVMVIPPKVLGAILNRLKVMADLDIAKHSLQSGVLALRTQERTFNARIAVSMTPAVGEEALIDFSASAAV